MFFKNFNKKVVYIIISFYLIAVVFLLGFQPKIDELNEYDIKDQGGYNSNKLNIFSTFIKIIAFLILFSAVAFLIYIIRRNISSEQLFSYTQSKYIKLIDMLPLGNNIRIYIVSIGEKVFALGVAEKSMNIILELNENDILLQDEKNNNDYDNNFRAVLMNMVNKLKGLKKTGQQNAELNEFRKKIESINYEQNEKGVGEDYFDQ